MPELPEVETMRRGILAIVGSTIADVRAAACTKKPIAISPSIGVFRRRATGARVASVDRVGKRVVIRLDTSDAIVLEPRMTGLVLLSAPPNEEHLRLRILLAGGRAKQLLYWDRRGLGSVRLVNPRQFAALYGDHKLGPDALRLSPELLRERLAASRRAVKVALLDQRAVAGIGNLYASEILHLAGIHPERRCDRLRLTDWARIQLAIDAILHAAIQHEGSTLSDGTYRNALNESGGYQNHHRVYDRAWEPCLTCGKSLVTRIIQAQRSTFFCVRCQPRSGKPRN